MIKLEYCPKCQKKTLSYVNNRKWSCSSCGLSLYNNVAAAVGILIVIKKDNQNYILLVKRGKDPRKGYLAVPGGFVDPGESAEEAAIREAKEEIGLEITNLKYITSASNNYQYKGIDYVTCDLFFSADIDYSSLDELKILLHSQDQNEIKGYTLCKIESLEDLNFIPLAFTSAKIALTKLLEANTTN